MSDRVRQMGDRAESSGAMDKGIRAGLVAYGVVHLLIGWLALQLALGEKEGQPSTSGALQQVAEQPFGKVMLWLIAVGMALLVIWRGLEVVRGEPDEDGAKDWASRASSALKAVIYGVIGVSAAMTALGSGGSGGGTDGMTAKLMQLPGGPLIVGAVGLGIVGYGGYEIYKGWSEKFMEKISASGTGGNVGKAYKYFGKAGYIAKGVAILIVGGLFLYAAVTQNSRKSGGLDAALLEVLHAPAGPFLLGVIAIGIACYGLFCFVQARHPSR